MTAMISKFKGKWRIIEMEQWDKEFIDLVEPGFIELDDKGNGALHFGCVYADLDCRIEQKNKDLVKVNFSFLGDDEGNEISGRGWAKLSGSQLEGYLCFHQGDESHFKAKLMQQKGNKK